MSRFAADAALAAQLAQACERFIADEGAASAARFGTREARVHRGLIISGDQFVASAAGVRALRDAVARRACRRDGRRRRSRRSRHEHARAVRGRADYLRYRRRPRAGIVRLVSHGDRRHVIRNAILTRFLEARGER